jgi:hypothetical protein
MLYMFIHRSVYTYLSFVFFLLLVLGGISLSLSLSLSYSLTCIGVHCSLVCDSFSRGYYSAYSMLHFFLTGRSSFSIQWRKKRGRVCELEPGMVGGPARDLALSRPFWQGKPGKSGRCSGHVTVPPSPLTSSISSSISPSLLTY